MHPRSGDARHHTARRQGAGACRPGRAAAGIRHPSVRSRAVRSRAVRTGTARGRARDSCFVALLATGRRWIAMGTANGMRRSRRWAVGGTGSGMGRGRIGIEMGMGRGCCCSSGDSHRRCCFRSSLRLTSWKTCIVSRGMGRLSIVWVRLG